MEVSWWTRPAKWPNHIWVLLSPEDRIKTPPFKTTPDMRENRYCEDAEEAMNFVEHCKKYRALNQPDVVVKLTWEIYGLDPVDLGEFEHAKSQPA